MSKRSKHARMTQTNVQATITGLSHEGRGIAHVDDKIVFIDNALPNEQIDFHYSRRSSKYNEGIATTIANPNPHRITPACQYYPDCGGCRLQHLAPGQQVLHKQTILLELLNDVAKATPNIVLAPLVNQTSEGYRRKARLGVRYVKAKDKVLVGFRERNGRYVMNMDDCQILHPKLAQLIQPLQQLFASLSCFQHIPQVEMAMGDEQAAIIIRHLQALTNDDLAKLAEFATRQTQLDIYLQAGGPDSITKFYPNDASNYLTYSLPDVKLRFRFHPTEFTQVNLGINRQMVAQAIDLLDIQQDDHVLDLFCGLGNFSLALARVANHVVGIEGESSLVQRAKENAELNSLSNCDFFTANLFEPCQAFAWYKQGYNKLLLDPPRSGAKEFIEQLRKPQFEKIVYVSCNPITLARDSKLLIEQHGYRLEAAGIMDMFPHTAHVESIALFSRIT